MITQAIDFREESDALYQLLEPVADEDYDRETLFKDWTINRVLGHLHMWNWAADVSLTDSDAFDKFIAELLEAMGAGDTLGDFEEKRLDGLKGKKLLAVWRDFYIEPYLIRTGNWRKNSVGSADLACGVSLRLSNHW